jgi:hypothetical protein
LASNGSKVVEHLPHYYKVKGSSPTNASSTERENGKRKVEIQPKVFAALALMTDDRLKLIEVIHETQPYLIH